MNKISEVQIIPIKAQNGLIAIASILFDENVYLGSIGVHSKINGNGYRLTYPTKNIGGKNLNIYHPINSETSRAIEEAIFAKVKEVIEKSNDRHHSFDIRKQGIQDC